MKSDRTWPLPRQPWVMKMTWSDLLFAHWPIDPDRVASLLPAGIDIDTREGMAWVGVVPFLMSNVGPRCCPPTPGLSRFLELNVRTYVTIDGKPGVWFFSLDAASRVAVRVARTSFNLPYMDACMSLDRDGSNAIRYRSRRTHRGEPPAEFDATYQVAGDFFEANVGSFEHWLTARYCLYSSSKRGCLFRGEIDHPPWTLAPASCDIRVNSMGESLGFHFAEKPHLLFAKPVDVRAWLVTQCGSETVAT
ncbi:MAG: DUF2071 domain-containing protein [Pirellulaceae bacterium]